MGMVSRSFHHAKMLEAGIRANKAEAKAERYAELHRARGVRINELEGRLNNSTFKSLEQELKLVKCLNGRLAGELHAIMAGKTRVYSADNQGNPKIYLVKE